MTERQSADVTEYPCPECGSDGPHSVVVDDVMPGPGGLHGTLTVECASCYAEFEVQYP